MKNLIFALLSAIVLAAPLDTPNQVTIEQSSHSGNGCPQGSVSSIISGDKTYITFGFDRFNAAIGPRANPNDKQKSCQLHLSLRYPQGFQVALMTATYHGWVRLDSGVTANFISSYYFSHAASNTASSRTTLSGGEFKNGKSYTKEDKIENAATVWSPCGANGILNINNRIALNSNNQQAQGEISNDDATIKFEHKLLLQWRRCNQAKKDYVAHSDTFENAELRSVMDSM
ncbi:hypothetical protein BT63DRAFT_457527 [Microthyrium microscopicum]|uniref:Secreted protein n=1 Tax=Microthyrium microscopicum TaxID=703497 RepID=A0A6A6U2R8_9PEZI|nr:hypothetical protein BT63DRAFT_457527 [Microthyrium microscopicum]